MLDLHFEKEKGSVRRLGTGLIFVALMLSLTAGPALADRPDKQSFSLVGTQLMCGDDVLTAISGSLVGTFHEHELSSGRVRVIFTERLDDVVFQDESGNTYRAVGADTANFTIDPDLGRGSEIGHLIFNITLIGEDGKYGDLRLHTRVTHSGEISIRDKGSCQFA